VRILIADDEPISRRMMEKILTQSGYEVTTVADGEAALEALTSKDAPRLALLDWMMPGLDGPEVCRRVRQQADGLYAYITLLTSKQSAQDIVTGLEAGADDYLTKPCNPEELKARLRTGQRILSLEDKLVEAREEMRTRATIDPLTGIWNRGSILALLKSEIVRCRREHKPLSLMLCDVDHFKQVNDAHGHLVGDQVLRQAGDRLRHAVRPYDGVGRYGGEEFVVLLPECTMDEAAVRAEALRARIERVSENHGVRVSASFGIAGIPESSAKTADVLGEADEALYRAKSEGRNRVCTAGKRPSRIHPDRKAAA